MKPLNEEILFQNINDHLVVDWRKFCEMQNELARKLLAVPGGPQLYRKPGDHVHAIAVGDVAWFLKEEQECIALYSADYTAAEGVLYDIATRHDIGLDWIDYDADVLHIEQEVLATALSPEHEPFIVQVSEDEEN